MALDGGMAFNIHAWLARNATAVDTLGSAAEDDTLFLALEVVGRPMHVMLPDHGEYIGACDWGLRTTLFGSEADHAGRTAASEERAAEAEAEERRRRRRDGHNELVGPLPPLKAREAHRGEQRAMAGQRAHLQRRAEAVETQAR